MKKIVLLILMAISFGANAQKTKSITVIKTGTTYKFSIDGIIHYDGDTPTDTSYYIAAMDEQYTMIYEPIILKSGSLQELYDFLKELHLAICNEEIKTTIPIQGCPVYVGRILGVRSGIIYNPNGNSRSYCSIDYGKLYGLMGKLRNYCEKQSKPLKI